MRFLKTVLLAVGTVLIAGVASANTFTFVQTTAFDLNNLTIGDVVEFDIMYSQATALTSLGFSVDVSPGSSIATGATQNVGGWFFPPSGPFISPAGTIVVTPTNVTQWAWFSLTPWPAGGIDSTATTAAEPAGRLGTLQVTANAVGTSIVSTFIDINDGINDDNFQAVAIGHASASLTVVPEPTTALLMGLGLVGLGLSGRRRA
jgi:hypothetical protein